MGITTNNYTLRGKGSNPQYTLETKLDGSLGVSRGGVQVGTWKSEELVLPGATANWSTESGSVVTQMLFSQFLPVLIKADRTKPAFKKTGAQTLVLSAGNRVMHKGKLFTYTSDTEIAVVNGFTSVGKDYSVYVRTDGTLYAVLDMKASPYVSALGDTLLGGFHYGAVATTETVASGLFATTGTGHIWTQADVDNLKGINKFSIWDLEYRPKCDPRGMTCVAGQFWVDIYFCGTQHITNGTSMYGSDVASGTVLPVIPLEFGGNGSVKYTTLNWYEANEIALSHGKRLMSYQEFTAAAYGVTENQSLGGTTVTIPTTLRQVGYTSKLGCEQMSGNHYTWGDNAHGIGGTVWVSGAGRGQTYGPPYGALFGGHRDNAGYSGSRCSSWNGSAWASFWYIGFRAACDFK